MSGSEYVTINGAKFRVSDHFQPSHYQIRTYIDVNSYNEIFNIVSAPEFSKEKFEIVEENGKKYKAIYNESDDSFELHELK
jgi:hypothetical protein